MTNVVPALLFVFLGVALLLAVLSWLFSRTSEESRLGFSPATRWFLVALRLVIGWHFVVEGLDKFKNPAWSGEAYLREASGPLAPMFRNLAGDSLIDKLTPEEDGSFPSTLAADWDAYLDAFAGFYELTPEQRGRAKALVGQVKTDMAPWFVSRPRTVEKISPEPPPLVAKMTMPDRIKEYWRLEARVREVEDKLPDMGSTIWPTLAKAKADLAKFRAPMQRDLNTINKEMKRALRGYLFELAARDLKAEYKERIDKARASLEKEIEKDVKANGIPDPSDWDAIDQYKDRWDEKLTQGYRLVFFESYYRPLLEKDKKSSLDPQATKIVENIIERQLLSSAPPDPLPVPARRPISAWSMLDWSDAFVKYGVTTVGILLILGLLTRLSCVLGASFLLMFFLAMPPLPWLPESPRAEGHYLYVNKNVIEMLALLVLATTRSGRWLGLDALIALLNPWRKPEESGTIN